MVSEVGAAFSVVFPTSVKPPVLVKVICAWPACWPRLSPRTSIVPLPERANAPAANMVVWLELAWLTVTIAVLLAMARVFMASAVLTLGFPSR